MPPPSAWPSTWLGRMGTAHTFGCWPLLQDDAVQRVLPQAEDGLADGEVALEGARRRLADELAGPLPSRALGEAPRAEGADVVVAVVEEVHEAEVRLPTEHQLAERRRHRLGEDGRADELRQRPPTGTAPVEAHAVEADQLQADAPAGAQPRRAPLEEGPVHVHLGVGIELVGREVLGRLDARDGVVGRGRLVVSPVLQPVVDVGHTAGAGVGQLGGAEREPDAAGRPMVANDVIEHRPPAAADVEDGAAGHVELAGEVIELAALRGRQVVTVAGTSSAHRAQE